MNILGLSALLHDLVVVNVGWFAAYWLGFNLAIPDEYLAAIGPNLLWIVPLHGVLYVGFGLYRGMWRYASLRDLRNLILAVAGASLLATAVVFAFSVRYVPGSVLLLHPLLVVLAMGGSRFLYRSWKDGQLFIDERSEAMPVLVLGAGKAAAALLSNLSRSPEWRVVGLLDDDRKKRRRLLHGVPIVGGIADIAEYAKRLGVEHVIIAMPSTSPAARRRAAELASEAGMKVFTVPDISDLLSHRVSISNIRKVELEDLLGRDRVVLDDDGLHGLLAGKAVMVTGAGGSIGSELCRQIAGFRPGLLVLFEISEYALYRIEQEFAERFPDCSVVCAVGDVRNAARLDEVVSRYRPQMIFHAAAYKHVPMMETGNAWEAIQNNVIGTLRLARAALRYGVDKFVLVSTDKAVNPVNVMGASKRLAEMVCQALQGQNKTKFVMVRFGNVLGSTGSVIPKFRAQIDKGGPVTVTHPQMTRYFMLIREAAQLVLQAGLMGRGGEVFVLDMGEPVKIADLARDMIRLSGFNDDEVKIVYTGVRPGEKLYEEELADAEHSLRTPHPKLRIATARRVDAEWLDGLIRWLHTDRVLTDQEVRRDLRQWVPDYRPAQLPELKAVAGAKGGG